MSDQTIQIRSFRVVFDLERRIHRIDRFRVPLPYGLPVRSLGYAAAALLVVLLLQSVPGIGNALATLDAPVRFVLVPIGVSVLVSRLRVDGRTAHAAALAWLSFLIAPRRRVAWEPSRPEASVVVGDFLVAHTPRARRRWRPAWQRPPRTPADPGEQLSFGGGLQMELW